MAQRVRHGEDFWRRIVEEQALSGLSVPAYCKRHKLKDVTFYKWRKRLSRAVTPARKVCSVSAAMPQLAVARGNGSLVEVVVNDKRPEATVRCAPQPVIELSLAGGVLVRLHGQVEPDWVERLVYAMRNAHDKGDR